MSQKDCYFPHCLQVFTFHTLETSLVLKALDKLRFLERDFLYSKRLGWESWIFPPRNKGLCLAVGSQVGGRLLLMWVQRAICFLCHGCRVTRCLWPVGLDGRKPYKPCSYFSSETPPFVTPAPHILATFIHAYKMCQVGQGEGQFPNSSISSRNSLPSLGMTSLLDSCPCNRWGLASQSDRLYFPGSVKLNAGPF